MDFFQKLYGGEICPAEEIPDTDEFKAAQKALTKASQDLFETLTAEQRKMLDKYQGAHAKCAELFYADAFKRGFLLGAEFIKEISKPDRLPKTE